MPEMYFVRRFIYKRSGYRVCTREVMFVRKWRRYSYVTEDQIRTAAQDLEKKLRSEDLDQEIEEANQWANLGQVGALAAQQLLHLAVAFGEEVHEFRCHL